MTSASPNPRHCLPRAARHALLLVAALGLSAVANAYADDWPQWRGRERNGISPERGLLAAWPEGGPSLVWRAEGLGAGFSSVSVADGRIYTMGDRDDRQWVVALSESDGSELWRVEVGPPWVDGYGGPRGTPTVDGERVYAVGTDGDLVAIDAVSGAALWRRSLSRDFGGFMSAGQGVDWRYAESPLVDGDRLIVTPGAADAMMVALDKITGEEIWRAAVPELGELGADGAAYSSIVVSEGAGVRQYVQLVGRGAIGVEAATGRFLWGYNRIANDVANIATPVIDGDHVFVTTGYGTGAALLQLQRDGDAVTAREVWFHGGEVLQNHHGGVVLVDGVLYTGTGHNRGYPIAVRAADGEVLWGPERNAGRNSAAITYADGRLYMRYQSGIMILVEASPAGYVEHGSFPIPDAAEFSWSHPVVANGRLYLREQDRLLSYDVRGNRTATADDDAPALRDAARLGRLEQVRALLAAGVPVDAADDYGSTALAFAARGGHAEVVALLLEAGADPMATDTFYEMSPVVRALWEGHLEIARQLLEAGATDNVQALFAAVEAGDVELARSAVAAAPLQEAVRDRLVEAAGEAGQQEIAELLASAEVDEPEGPAPFDPATLPEYAGTYRDETGEVVVEIEAGDGVLLLREQGGAPRALGPAGGRSFQGVGDEGLMAAFYGRGGTVEGMQLRDGARTVELGPVDPEEAALLRGEPAADRRIDLGADPELRTGEWPGFRGEGASGFRDGAGVPVEWDVETGRNILWTTDVPGIATSSPVVWGDHVFVTTAVSETDDTVRTGLYGDVAPVEDLSPHEFLLLAVHRRSGEVLWQRTVYSGAPLVKRHPKSSQANSSPATDGERVVVLFGTVGRLAAFDFSGELLWQRDIGALDSGWFYDPDFQWGHAASPVIYEDLVIVQADVQEDPHIAAFSLATGETVWKTTRDEIPTFSTPTIYRGAPRDELVTNGTRIRGYDPRTGEELWRLAPNSEVIVGTPVAGRDLVYVTAGYPPIRPIYAVQPGASGDISLPDGADTSEAIAWSKDRGGTYIPTPLLYRGVFYTNANNGRLTAYDARTGEMLYRARIGGTGGSFVASPVAADGRLYFSSEDGVVHVAEAGSEHRHLASNDMGEVIWATPAVTEGVLVVRTLHHLYGIAEDSPGVR